MNSNPSPPLNPHAFSSGNDDAELLRLLRFGNLGWIPPQAGAVFVPEKDQDFEQDWRRWLDGPVAAMLGEHILSVRLLGQEMKAREILGESLRLDSVLGPDGAARSRAAGSLLLGVLATARHARLAERITALLEAPESGQGRDSIHLATAVALHSVIFNFPPLTVLLGYAYAEWRCALLSLGHPAARVEAGRFLDENPGMGAWAGRILRTSSETFYRASFA
jgi:hypothetical protein